MDCDAGKMFFRCFGIGVLIIGAAGAAACCTAPDKGDCALALGCSIVQIVLGPVIILLHGREK